MTTSIINHPNPRFSHTSALQVTMATPIAFRGKRVTRPPFPMKKVMREAQQRAQSKRQFEKENQQQPHPLSTTTQVKRYRPNVSLRTLKMPLEVKPKAIRKVFKHRESEIAAREKSLMVMQKLTADNEMKKHVPLPRRKLPKKERPTHESWKKLHVNIRSVDVTEDSVHNLIVQQEENPEFAAGIQIGTPLYDRIKHLRSLGFNWSVVQAQVTAEYLENIKASSSTDRTFVILT